MNYTKLGTAVCASSLLLLGGCGILETVDVDDIRFDSNTYIVQPGDTLESVADRYSLDPNALASANALEANRLLPGQRLTLVRGDSDGRVISSRNQLPDASQVVMVPAAGTAVPATEPLRQLPAEGVVLPVAPREQVVAVRDPAESTDSLLDDNSPLFVSDLPAAPGALPTLPTLPGALPTLPDSTVINDVRVDQLAVNTDNVIRPQGTETIVQDVRSGTPVAVAQAEIIPAAGSVTVNDDISAISPVKSVTVNTRADGWNWPALGQITREFDLREINRQGLDIDAGPGAGVQAAADGEVVYSGRDLASYGNLVILRHEDNFLSAYSKVSDIFVKENQKVKAGDLIAVVGDEQSDSTELHFEIRRNGEPVNPVDYLPAL